VGTVAVVVVTLHDSATHTRTRWIWLLAGGLGLLAVSAFLFT
jgi:hypothetical protein